MIGDDGRMSNESFTVPVSRPARDSMAATKGVMTATVGNHGKRSPTTQTMRHTKVPGR